MAIWNRYCD